MQNVASNRLPRGWLCHFFNLFFFPKVFNKFYLLTCLDLINNYYVCIQPNDDLYVSNVWEVI